MATLGAVRTLVLRRLAWLVVGTMAVILVDPPPVDAAGVLSLKLGPRATILSGGEAARVAVRVRCAPGLEVLEAFVYLVQDDETSQFAPVPAECDGRTHQLSVVVSTADGQLGEGEARLSGYILLDNGVSESPTKVVVLRS